MVCVVCQRGDALERQSVSLSPASEGLWVEWLVVSLRPRARVCAGCVAGAVRAMLDRWESEQRLRPVRPRPDPAGVSFTCYRCDAATDALGVDGLCERCRRDLLSLLTAERAAGRL